MAALQHPALSSAPLPAPQITFHLQGFTPALGKDPWKESSQQQVLRTRGTAVLHAWRGCTEGSVSMEVGRTAALTYCNGDQIRTVGGEDTRPPAWQRGGSCCPCRGQLDLWCPFSGAAVSLGREQPLSATALSRSSHHSALKNHKGYRWVAFYHRHVRRFEKSWGMGEARHPQPSGLPELTPLQPCTPRHT